MEPAGLQGRCGNDALKVLWERALAGERGALRALLESVAPEVTRVARSIVHAADLDDVVQESLMALLTALPTFRGDSGVRHFARRIAVRTAMRSRRRRRRRDQGMQPLEAAAGLGGGEPPDAGVRAERRAMLLRGLLDELPEAQAETLALRVVLGLSLVETAEATGVPVNTVRSRMRLARESLRARIEADPALGELLEAGS